MKNMMQKDKFGDQRNFEGIELKVASPDRILEWSHGEVTKPETMNYRTQRSEKNGLFDEKIFGPEKDFECYCGKYRGIRYKGIICEKCGVELTRSIVRRERMGHIELSTPVAHIWFLRSLPSRIGIVLGMATSDLEKVVYFAGYLVTKVSEDEKTRVLKELENEYKNKVKTLADEKTKDAVAELYTNTKRDIEGLVVGRVLDEVEYHKFSLKFGPIFEAEIGAEAVYNLFKKLDLNKLYQTLEKDLETVGSTEREKLLRRLSVIRGMITSNIRPEWMFLTRIPVIPPALRPMVALEGGRTATSDINDLYRRVINRNNRLKKLKEIHAPDVILRNEKRILQEAVDALIDNSIRHGNALFAGVNQAQRRPLKSLADNLKGKKGLLRGNLLGKRVDYSGRSVIVVGPDMKLDECGLPKHMALELFRPFVIADLLKKELAFNIRGASRLIDDGIPEVWAILEDVIRTKYVLLNRAPTLHRLGIQAFRPILIEGNAIQLHPLVCDAYNADFDGDTMAVHLPLSVEAQAEAREIMASNKNILKPGSGNLITSPGKEIILGSFWMTKEVAGQKGEGKVFESKEAAFKAVDYGELSYRAKIKVLPGSEEKFKAFNGELIETTVGRLKFNDLLPADYPFINKVVSKSAMAGIMDDLIAKIGVDALPKILDAIKDFGFKYSTHSGTTFGIDEVRVPESKGMIIDKARKEADTVLAQYNDGLITEDERLRKNIEIWHDAKSTIEKLVPESLDKNGSAYDLITSGARGNLAQLTQMAGMKGLIQNSQGQTIEVPIISSALEGLTPIEYFISTHGARKGMTDTALNTANAGYLTRKLFVVAQDVVITEHDCGTKEGTVITRKTASGIPQPLSKGIFGRVLAEDIATADGTVLFKRNHLLTKTEAKMVDEQDSVASVIVRSPLTCKTHNGICSTCYGLDLGKNRLIDIGEAVGTVAAQAIGEPGTQLTMRTFHTGGAATVAGDITAGLPRVVEVFEKRRPKNPAAIAKVDGVVSEIRNTGKEKVIVILPDLGEKKVATKKAKAETEHGIALVRVPLVKVGDRVHKGDFLSDGSADIDEIFEYAGKEKAEQYIISEIKKLYELQGEAVSQKHIEVIIRQMFTRVRIKEAGDSTFAVGDVVESFEVSAENRRLRAEGKIEAKAEAVPMGITEVSLSRKSFLSAASFQNTNKILIGSAIRGSQDELRGLMENVIIGRLIPAGTGFKGSEKANLIEEISKQAGAQSLREME